LSRQVHVTLTIDANGSVTDEHTEETLPFRFIEDFKTTLKSWLFLPGLHSGILFQGTGGSLVR